ncbi:MAG TPA: hypothetical protein VF228_19620 [Iamia sp.]
MADEPSTAPAPARRRWVDAAEFVALRQAVSDLRLLLQGEVRTRRLVVVDEAGIGRIRMTADGDACRLVMADPDGFERIVLTAQPDIGTVVVSARGELPTRVDVFALDAEDRDDVPMAGLELIDHGDSVGGFTVHAGREAGLWTDPLVPRSMGAEAHPSPPPATEGADRGGRVGPHLRHRLVRGAQWALDHLRIQAPPTRPAVKEVR